MGSGELVASGDRQPPRIRDGLILPVLLAVAAWAVDWFTRSALGDWRYVPVAALGLCAIYFTVPAIVGIALIGMVKTDGRGIPRRPSRRLDATLAVLVVAAVVLHLVWAVRDHSILDAATALVIVVWACLVPGVRPSADMSRSRTRAYRAAACLLPVWVLGTAVFRLR